jgi:hypothetical protein
MTLASRSCRHASLAQGDRVTIVPSVISATRRSSNCLRRASQATGCTILGKAEFMNPGGSVKDRAALAIIQDGIARGRTQARRHDRRGHRGQHRHRPGAGRRALGFARSS